jgi:hypothetical protein
MIYGKTSLGQQAFNERAPSLNSHLRIAYLMVDGKRTLDEVLAATAGMGVTLADIDHLRTLGFIAPVVVQTKNDRRAILSSAQQTVIFIEAAHRATALTASMGLRGFKLNLAVESAKTFAHD